MADNQNVTTTAKPRLESSESIEMLLAQIESGDSLANKLTEDHISKIIDQRGLIIEKVHSDRQGDRWDNKYYVTIGLIVTVLILGAVLLLKPEYFSQTLAAVLGGGGGFGAGYGIAKKQ